MKLKILVIIIISFFLLRHEPIFADDIKTIRVIVENNTDVPGQAIILFDYLNKELKTDKDGFIALPVPHPPIESEEIHITPIDKEIFGGGTITNAFPTNGVVSLKALSVTDGLRTQSLQEIKDGNNLRAAFLANLSAVRQLNSVDGKMRQTAFSDEKRSYDLLGTVFNIPQSSRSLPGGGYGASDDLIKAIRANKPRAAKFTKEGRLTVNGFTILAGITDYSPFIQDSQEAVFNRLKSR